MHSTLLAKSRFFIAGITLKATMRRLLAILLLAAFGLPTVAPLLAQTQDPDSNLPACCRRNGTHHCALSMAAQSSNAPTVAARCPVFPQHTAVANLAPAAFLATHPNIKLPIAAQSAVAHTKTRRRISRERTHQTRGPPINNLA
jgi:hypothetical protein